MEYYKINTETPESEIKKTKKFIAKDKKGINYEIEMELTCDSIKFKTEINDGIITKKYSNISSFDNLKTIIVFNLQDTIEEIYEQLEIYINDAPVHCEKKENNIIIKLTTKIKKFSEIFFELKQEEIEQKQSTNIVIEKINILEAKNKEMELKITNLELNNNNLEAKISAINEENISLKKEIELMKNELNIINEYINTQKEIERKKNINFADSLIVEESEKNMICNWIKPNAKIKAKLLYRVSRDGDGPDIFHKYCDNQGPTIIFAKISNGYRFGGYTGISWDNKGGWTKDKDAFLFSLNNKLKIMNNNTEHTVYHGIKYGPDFGNNYNEFVMNYNNNKCLTGKINHFYDGGDGFTFKIKDFVGIDEKYQYLFDVEDYEVYSIIC